jgi:hypothetical protein
MTLRGTTVLVDSSSSHLGRFRGRSLPLIEAGPVEQMLLSSEQMLLSSENFCFSRKKLTKSYANNESFRENFREHFREDSNKSGYCFKTNETAVLL